MRELLSHEQAIAMFGIVGPPEPPEGLPIPPDAWPKGGARYLKERMRERCVGCSAEFDAIEGPVHRYMTSSPACWSCYGELLGVLAIQPGLTTPRIQCVDAFAVQHPGTPNVQAIQSVAVHLLNMYGYLVRGLPVTPPRLAGHKGAFHWLNPPAMPATRTVRDMPVSGDAAAIAEASRAWVEAVWAAWAGHHAQIAQWHEAYAVA